MTALRKRGTRIGGMPGDEILHDGFPMIWDLQLFVDLHGEFLCFFLYCVNEICSVGGKIGRNSFTFKICV